MRRAGIQRRRNKGVSACVCACATLAALAASRTAGAFPSSRLVYTRAATVESCPDEPAIRSAVAKRLGYDPFFPAADKIIVAEITRSDDKLRATVELIDERGIVKGVREFHAPSDQCEELASTVALAISIAIDPASLDNPRPSPPPARQETHSEPVAPVAVEPIPQPNEPRPPHDEASRPADRITVFPGLSVTSSIGTAPNVAMGFAVSLGLRRHALSLGLEGRADLPTAGDVSGGGKVSTSLLAASLVPCVHPGAVYLCAVGSLGSLRGEGEELAKTGAGRGLYAALGARIGLDVPISDFLVFRPQLDLLATMARVELDIDNQRAWRSPPFAVVAAAGLAWRFP